MRVSRSSIRIEAPRETVWSVVTEPAYVKQWQYGSDLQTDWSDGSQIRFISEWQGQTFEQWGTVVHVDAPNRLAYSLGVRRSRSDGREARDQAVYCRGSRWRIPGSLDAGQFLPGEQLCAPRG